MKKEAIINLLEEKQQELFNWLENQPDEIWNKAPKGKWTTGQHIQHLVEVIKKVNYALSFPTFLLKYKFGTSNRKVRSYNEVIKRYQEKLSVNKEKAKEFNKHIQTPALKKKEQLLATLQIQNKKLQYKTNQWKDKKLDNLILPHPLLGKMPVREMIMFMAHHTEHHTKTLINKH